MSTMMSKLVVVALSLATMSGMALVLAQSEQQSVAQAKAQGAPVHRLEPVIVVAKRDVRKLARIEVLGHRNEQSLAQGGTRRNSPMSARPAN